MVTPAVTQPGLFPSGTAHDDLVDAGGSHRGGAVAVGGGGKFGEGVGVDFRRSQ